MKIIVRVDLITDWGDISTIEVGQIDRPSQELEPETVGLLMEDGSVCCIACNKPSSEHKPKNIAPFPDCAVGCWRRRRIDPGRPF